MLYYWGIPDTADILDTIIGSIGVILVAPLTAVAGGVFLTKKNI